MKIVVNRAYGGFSVSKAFLDSICEGYNHVYDCDKFRHDSRLIEYIEKYGAEKASGNGSCLAVVEVPKGKKYIIVDYDGFERAKTIDDFDWEVAD